MLHVLVIDDDPASLNGLAELVRQEGFNTATADSLKVARDRISKQPPDLLLTDMKLPDGSGLDLLRDMDDLHDADVILVTGHASVDSAVEALRLGAADYLTKPVDFSRLKTVLANFGRTHELKEEIGTLREELRSLGRFGLLVGASMPMQSIYDLITKVAPTNASVFLTGESGTGKELVAQTLHNLSKRRKGPFVAVNCGAISPNLFESELFGHEPGSFTGARKKHEGHFERASGGVIFLDEIGEMPADLQVKLLRVLEAETLLRVGGTEEIPFDVRLIAATNRPPEELIAEDLLREDLYYRLNVFPIHMPPLRERLEDVELLAVHFLQELNRSEGTRKTISRGAMKRLHSYSWPGNVRELKNVLQRAFIMAGERIEPHCLPLKEEGQAMSSAPRINVKLGTSIAEVERRLILATLEQCDGDKKKASEILGISLKTLYTRLSVYGEKN